MRVDYLKIHFRSSFINFGHPKYVQMVFIAVILKDVVVLFFVALVMPLGSWILDF